MDRTRHLARALLFLARITGTLLLAFLLFMLIGHLFGNANGATGMTFRSSTDLAGFLLFPLGSIVGLALAYRWQFLGGAVMLASFAALLVLRPDVARLPFVALVMPALLYLGSWWLHRRTGQGKLERGL